MVSKVNVGLIRSAAMTHEANGWPSSHADHKHVALRSIQPGEYRSGLPLILFMLDLWHLLALNVDLVNWLARQLVAEQSRDLLEALAGLHPPSAMGLWLRFETEEELTVSGSRKK